MGETKYGLLYRDLGTAILSFQQSLEIKFEKFTAIEQDTILNGQMQKFEYNIELLWKLLKAYFYEWREVRFQYPKEVIKAYFQEEKIDEETFLILNDALDSRNLLSHVYKEDIFRSIHPKLKSYAGAIATTYASIKP